MTDPTPSERRAATTSLGELVGEVTRDMSTLMRQELALAKAEVRESATQSAKGAGLLGGAGYAAGMAVLFLSIALWAALATLVGEGWSAVIVAVIWAVIGAILFTVGRTQLKKVQGVPQTAATLQEIPETFTRNEENR
ncbi:MULTISPECIES: phage holin family protein [Microbacterium]|uniref:phage holin family protein n=1 Tax=Microbacterium TaxID=33882 RepID=UPI00278AC386|nr:MULTISPECIES: phage holin family protein [Microbacterium]MDQ1084809.1 fatty acid desaturase [Microbacterium sp. SORGH_AS_0344]MDQ1169912.1 fatty acid desaturase [Microbacterium proteolyticum]